MTEPCGPEAKAAFDQSSALVKFNRYSEALAVKMRESDRLLIERRIRALIGAGANGGALQNEVRAAVGSVMGDGETLHDA